MCNTESKVGVVEHLNGQTDTLSPEVDNQRITLELSILVCVQLNARLSTIDFFRNDAAFRKQCVDLLDSRIFREGRHINRSVFALGGLFLLLLDPGRCFLGNELELQSYFVSIRSCIPHRLLHLSSFSAVAVLVRFRPRPPQCMPYVAVLTVPHQAARP